MLVNAPYACRPQWCTHDVTVVFACRWCCSISERLVLDSALDEVFKVRVHVAALLAATPPCSACKRVEPSLWALLVCCTLSSTSRLGLIVALRYVCSN